MNLPCRLIVAFFPCLLLACGKDNLVTVPYPNRLAGDSARSWRIVRFTLDGTARFIPACRADDRLTFRLNGTYHYQSAPDRCQSDEPDFYEGTWRLNPTRDTLALRALINGTFTERKLKISTLSADQLKWQYQSAAALAEETYY